MVDVPEPVLPGGVDNVLTCRYGSPYALQAPRADELMRRHM